MRARVVSDQGSGPATVVFVPGIDGTGEFMLETATRVEQRFRLIRLRYEGAGVPGGDDAPYARLARTIIECFDERGVERAVLLAESFGVSLALRTALDHPGRVRALALVNGFAHYKWRARLLSSRVVASITPAFLYRLGRRSGSVAVTFGPRRDADVEAKFLACRGAVLDAAFRERLRMIRDVDLRDELAALRQPVALFASTRDRIVPSVPAAREMLARLPNAELELLEGSGHIVLPFPDEDWCARLDRLVARAEEFDAR